MSLADIRQVFDGLLAGQSREAASAWAVARMQAADTGELFDDPPDDKERIWVALTFLGGVDAIVDMAGSYQYGPPDFEFFRP